MNSAISDFDTSPVRRNPWRRVRVFISVLGLLIAMWVIWNWNTPGHLDFWIHRGAYEQKVNEAKQLPMDEDGNASSSPRGIYATSIHKDKDGSTTISFVTLDEGHFGYYGYLYAEGTPNLNPRFKYQQLSERWWTFHDNNW